MTHSLNSIGSKKERELNHKVNLWISHVTVTLNIKQYHPNWHGAVKQRRAKDRCPIVSKKISVWRFLSWWLHIGIFLQHWTYSRKALCISLRASNAHKDWTQSGQNLSRRCWHYVSEHVKVTETGTKMRCSLDDIMEIWKNLALNAWRHPQKDLDHARKDLDSCVSRLTAAPKGLVSCVTHIRPRLTSGYVRSFHVVFVLCVIHIRPRLTSGYVRSLHVVFVLCVIHIRPRLTSGYVRSLHVVFVLCVTRFRPRLTSRYICSFHVVVTQTVILLFYRPVLSSAFVVVVVVV